MKNYPHLEKARAAAAAHRKNIREETLRRLHKENSHLLKNLENGPVAKLLLATLYWCEGSKRRKGALVFGNSDPNMITLFLKLLRNSYAVDERKFRCTVQCRASQDVNALEAFWSNVTGIPRAQFYGARIDARTIGKPTLKLDYKGVCRLDYFSAEVFRELTMIGELLSETSPIDTGR